MISDPLRNGLTRYNADDQASDSVSNSSLFNGTGFPANSPNNWTKQYFSVRYDPKGNQILSAGAKITSWERTSPATAQDTVQYKSSATVFIEGQPQFIHTLNSQYGAAMNRGVFVWWYSPIGNQNLFKTQDETFSLADSLKDDTNPNNIYARLPAPQV